MSFFLSSFCDLDPYSLSLFLSYCIKKESPSPSLQSLINLFTLCQNGCLDVPQLRQHLKHVWLACNKRLSLHWIEYNNRLQPSIIRQQDGIFSAEYEAAVSSLRANGFYVFSKLLPHAYLSPISKLVFNSFLNPEFPDQSVHSHISVHRRDLNSYNHVSRFFYPPAVLSSPIIRQLACEPSLLSIVQSYLCTKRFSVKSTGWLSVGRSNLSLSELSANAQLFHIDLDALRFLKIFIYLSDVTPSTGPHVYVSTSNLPFSNLQNTLSSLQPSLRITDDKLHQLFENNLFKTHLGLAGTVIIEDTSGFHKGLPLHYGYNRDLLSFVYESGRLSKA